MDPSTVGSQILSNTQQQNLSLALSVDTNQTSISLKDSEQKTTTTLIEPLPITKVTSSTSSMNSSSQTVSTTASSVVSMDTNGTTESVGPQQGKNVLSTSSAVEAEEGKDPLVPVDDGHQYGPNSSDIVSSSALVSPDSYASHRNNPCDPPEVITPNPYDRSGASSICSTGSEDYRSDDEFIGISQNGGTNTFSITIETQTANSNNHELSPRRKAAESIRAKLRKQEERLSTLMSHRRVEVQQETSHEDKIQEVKDTLLQVESEKAELEQKLLSLQQRHAEEEAAASAASPVIGGHLETVDEEGEGGRRGSMGNSPKKERTMDDVPVSDEHDAFLRDKLSGIQQGFAEQATRVEALQDALNHRDAEINLLHLEISNKLRRIIELEYDLRCHSIHYTEYAQQQLKMGEDAMNEINDMMDYSCHGSVNGDDSSTSSMMHSMHSHNGAVVPKRHSMTSMETNSLSATGLVKRNSLHPVKAKRLISKLLGDLDSLEDLYKNEKLNALQMKKQLQKENDMLKIQIRALESENIRHLAADRKRSSRSKNNVIVDAAAYTNEQLRKRIATLEATKFLYQKEIMTMQEELRTTRKTADMDAAKHESEMTRLTLALEGLHARCNVLESYILPEDGENGNFLENKQNHDDDVMSSTTSESEFGVGMGIVQYPSHLDMSASKAPSKHTNVNRVPTDSDVLQYTNLEHRIMECYQHISKLEAESELKDAQIENLKREIVQLRVKDIINPADQNRSQGVHVSELDVEILSSIDKKTRMMQAVLYSEKMNNSSSVGTTADLTGYDASFTEITTSFDDSFIFSSSERDVSAATNAYIADLRRQLDEVRQELAKKDQELTIEKAKSSCMAANLLDKIDALDKDVDYDEEDSLHEIEDEDDDAMSSPTRTSGSRSYELSEHSCASQQVHEAALRNHRLKQKQRKKIFSRIPLRFYL